MYMATAGMGEIRVSCWLGDIRRGEERGKYVENFLESYHIFTSIVLALEMKPDMLHIFPLRQPEVVSAGAHDRILEHKG